MTGTKSRWVLISLNTGLRLKSYKLEYSLRRIAEILTNPFYCGKLAHKALEGKLVDGKQEKFQEHNESLQEHKNAIKRQLTDISCKLERLEERYILEEITGELYSKYKSKFEKEAEALHKEMKQNKIELSKLEDYIAYSHMCYCNLGEMWHSGDYTQRQGLQNALFEGGIVYDREKDQCRGIQVNEFVSALAHISGSLAIFGHGSKKNIHLASLRPFRAESGTCES